MTVRLSAVVAALLAALLLFAWPMLSDAWTRAAVAAFQAQQDLNGQLAQGMRGLDTGGLGAMLGLVGLSFLYGVLHAIGPGHGKAVMSAYVLADARRLRQGLALAWIASGLQALAAILLVGGAMLLLGAAAREVQVATLSLERIGYALVAALGLVMILAAMRRSLGHRGHAHRHAHEHHGGACIPAAAPGARWRDALAVLSVGIRPCGGAVLVLAFANAVGALAAGILATIAMAAGTAITVSSLALTAFYSKRLALKGAGERWAFIAENALSIIAGAALVLLGALLLAGSFARPVSPFRI